MKTVMNCARDPHGRRRIVERKTHRQHGQSAGQGTMGRLRSTGYLGGGLMTFFMPFCHQE
jgi:hypothetical protein